MTKNPYIDANLKMITEEGFYASLEGKITLHDNFNQYVDLNGESARRMSNFPIKVQGMTVLLFCMKGTIRVKLAFNEYELHRDDIFIIQSGQLGEFHEMLDDTKFFILFVSNNFTDPLTHINDSRKLQDLLFRGPLHHCTDSEMDAFCKLYGFIRACIVRNYLYKDDMIRGYVYAILYSIYSLSYAESQQQGEEQLPKGVTPRQMEIYKQFINLVQEYAPTEHKTAFYASRLCITTKYLSQIVAIVSGRFARDFINESLIMESKALLRTDMSIQQICDKLNFNSSSFFSRFFKNATGMTPYEYKSEK